MIGSITQTNSVQHLSGTLVSPEFSPYDLLTLPRTNVGSWCHLAMYIACSIPDDSLLWVRDPSGHRESPTHRHAVALRVCSLSQSVPACFAEAGEPPAFISAVAQTVTRIPIQTLYFPRKRRPLVVGRHRFAVRQQTCFLKRVSIMIGLIAIHSFNK